MFIKKNAKNRKDRPAPHLAVGRRGLPNELYDTTFPSLAPRVLFDGGGDADEGDFVSPSSFFSGGFLGLPRRLLPPTMLALEVSTGVISIDFGKIICSSVTSAINFARVIVTKWVITSTFLRHEPSSYW